MNLFPEDILTALCDFLVHSRALNNFQFAESNQTRSEKVLISSTITHFSQRLVGKKHKRKDHFLPFPFPLDPLAVLLFLSFADFLSSSGFLLAAGVTLKKGEERKSKRR